MYKKDVISQEIVIFASDLDNMHMEKQPKLMSIPRMRDILEPHVEEISKRVYMDNHLAIIRGTADMLRLIILQQPPFTFDDMRMGIILRGEATTNLNLIEKHFTAGMLIYIGPGSIINPVSISPDFEFYGVGIPTDFPFQTKMPQAMNGQVRDFQIVAGEADLVTARHILDTLWHVVHQPDYNMETASSLIAAKMYHYDVLYRKHTDNILGLQSREQTLFDRFLQLVNQHAPREHHIDFYASRMCLTERYLGTVIRKASGVTAKEWIDRALIAHIKVELRHTDKSLTQISEELSFPNPSFFSKYFKRLTQMTPAEYRKS